MRLKAFVIAAFFAALLVCSEASAQGNPTPGRMTTVTCAHDSSQKYSCYVPSKYSPGRKWRLRLMRSMPREQVKR